jgi:hypothetical protein
VAIDIIDLDRDPEDYILYGAKQSPGFVVLSGHDRNKEWDVQKAKGQVGASSTLNGDGLGEFTATFTLVDQQDFDDWEDFQRLIESTTSGTAPVALPIYHPDLARQKYTEVVNRGVGGITYRGDGSRVVAVKFGEHRPPKPKPAAKAQPKPAGRYAETEGDIGTGRRVPAEDPNANAKEELARLRQQARET